MRKIKNFRLITKRFYEKSILWMISILGFASVASCDDGNGGGGGGVQPEYGVVPLYGVPTNIGYLYIKGKIQNAKDSLPVPDIKVTCSGKYGAWYVVSDSSGNYAIDYRFWKYESNISFYLTDNNLTDGKDYASKNFVITIDSNLYKNSTVNIFVNEK